MTGNHGGMTGDLERELCVRRRLGVFSISMSPASSKAPNLLWSFVALSDPLGILFDVSLSFVGFVLVLGLFVSFCAFVCPDHCLFVDKFCLFCELVCGCALGFDDDVDSEHVFDFGLFCATITFELSVILES